MESLDVLGFNILIYMIIPYVLMYFIIKFIYKHDINKHKKTFWSINIFGLFTLADILAIHFLSEDKAMIFDIVIYLALAIILYNVISYILIKSYGRDKKVVTKVVDEKLLVKLQIELDSKNLDLEKIEEKDIKLKDGYSYYIKPNEFHHEKIVRVSNEISNLFDIILLVLVFVFTLSAIFPILLEFYNIQKGNSDYLYAILAFLGAYVLSPFFPDLYYSIVLVRNPYIEFGSYIKIYHNNIYVYGKIIDMNFFSIVIFDKKENIPKTIPHSIMGKEIIGSYTTNTGRILQYSYVLDEKSAEKFGPLVFLFLTNYAKENKSDIYADLIDVEILDAQFGWPVDFIIRIKKIENYEQIKRKIRSGLSKVARENSISLPTPNQIQIVK